MKQPGIFKIIRSYLAPVHIHKYQSQYSGELFLTLENGRKVLNTETVNYSFNSLHRVFKQAFKKTNLGVNSTRSILLLGLGGGSIVEILRNGYQINHSIKAVEIDPVIIQLARSEFNIEKFHPIDLIEMDAFEFMQNNQEKFSLICIDVFIHDTVPDKFLTIDFLQQLINSLDPNCSLYFNIMESTKAVKARVAEMQTFLHTISEIKEVTVLKIEENNRMLVAKK